MPSLDGRRASGGGFTPATVVGGASEYMGIDGCLLEFDRKRHCVIRCDRDDCWE